MSAGHCMVYYCQVRESATVDLSHEDSKEVIRFQAWFLALPIFFS